MSCQHAPLVVLPLVVLALAGCPAPVTTQGAGEPARASGARPSGGCDEARLALGPDTVVAEIDGAAVTAKDLGPELASAEEKALRGYCDAVDEARRQALTNHINDVLLERAAKQAGSTPQDYVQSRVMTAMSTPIPEEELLKFYNENKNESAPPFELVRPQVEQAMQRQRVEQTIDGLITELTNGAKITRKLPDIAPAPFEIGVAPHTPSKGAAQGTVTVTEFADFECPYCSRAATTMSALAARYGDRVRFTYRHFPLSFHPNARRAAEFSQCAGEQGKFWAFHDKAYENQRALDEASLRAHAEAVGVDGAALEACLASGRVGPQIEADLKLGQDVGVEGTPSFYINGRAYRGNPSPEELGAAIEQALQAGS